MGRSNCLKVCLHSTVVETSNQTKYSYSIENRNDGNRQFIFTNSWGNTILSLKCWLSIRAIAFSIRTAKFTLKRSSVESRSSVLTFSDRKRGFVGEGHLNFSHSADPNHFLTHPSRIHAICFGYASFLEVLKCIQSVHVPEGEDVIYAAMHKGSSMLREDFLGCRYLGLLKFLVVVFHVGFCKLCHLTH